MKITGAYPWNIWYENVNPHDNSTIILHNNPIRLIDTVGLGDTKGEEYDEKITKDIQKLFEST